MSEHYLLTSREHYVGPIHNIISLPEGGLTHVFIRKRRNETCKCLAVTVNDDASHNIELSYFAGVDWIVENQQAIYVEPKLNDDTEHQTDYLRILFEALKHPEVAEHTNDLFEIKWDSPAIPINQQQDLLTPLLVVQFLSIVKQIVKKGLKKSYYKVQQNLYGRVKGKVMIATTVKRNLLKNKPLHTWCSFDEFGFNGLENRMVKKALTFIQRYMPRHPNLQAQHYLQQTLSYILPAFDTVNEEVDINDVLHTKTNAFYKEYEEALRFARVILRRFGYNISNASSTLVATPPFWIDMSKLFELHILGLLKDRFGKEVTYHFSTNGNELDFILKSGQYKVVVDAKYKPKYKGGLYHEDMRQVSGYARLEKVYHFLEKTYPDSVDCLVVYPDQESSYEKLKDIELLATPVAGYYGVYKIAVKLPVVA